MIGYQNDYFARDGILRGVIEADADRVLANTLVTLHSLQNSAITMITTPTLFTEDYQELEDPVGILKTIKEVGAFSRGSKGCETIAEMQGIGKCII